MAHPLQSEAYNVAIITTECVGAAPIKANASQIIAFSVPDRKIDHEVKFTADVTLEDSETYGSIIERVCSQLLAPQSVEADLAMRRNRFFAAKLVVEKRRNLCATKDVEGKSGPILLLSVLLELN